jgi:hypothetical protein
VILFSAFYVSCPNVLPDEYVGGDIKTEVRHVENVRIVDNNDLGSN